MELSSEEHNRLQEAARYIRSHSDAGVPLSTIRQHFLQYGWTSSMVDQAVSLSVGLPPDLSSEQPSGSEPIHPQKYRVMRAFKDMIMAIQRQPLRYCGSLVAGIALYIVGVIVLSIVTGIILNGLTGSLLFILLLIVGICQLGWYALASSFILAATAPILVNKVNAVQKPFLSILREAAKPAPRAAVAYGLSMLIIWLPLLLTLLYVIYSAFNSFIRADAVAGHQALLFIAVLFGLLWAIIASLRLILVQQVAIFEPQLSVRQTLSRSYYLLRHGGQWFVVKLALGILVALIVLSVVTHTSINQLIYGNASWLSTALSLIVAFALQAVLTLLYANRAAVRS